jgi:hypothetical protein
MSNPQQIHNLIQDVAKRNIQPHEFYIKWNLLSEHALYQKSYTDIPTILNCPDEVVTFIFSKDSEIQDELFAAAIRKQSIELIKKLLDVRQLVLLSDVKLAAETSNGDIIKTIASRYKGVIPFYFTINQSLRVFEELKPILPSEIETEEEAKFIISQDFETFKLFCSNEKNIKKLWSFVTSSEQFHYIWENYSDCVETMSFPLQIQKIIERANNSKHFEFFYALAEKYPQLHPYVLQFSYNYSISNFLKNWKTYQYQIQLVDPYSKKFPVYKDKKDYIEANKKVLNWAIIQPDISNQLRLAMLNENYEIITAIISEKWQYSFARTILDHPCTPAFNYILEHFSQIHPDLATEDLSEANPKMVDKRKTKHRKRKLQCI